MARPTSRLSARTVATASPGYHADGNGLYLHVGPTSTRSWIFRYQLQGRRREMGLGSAAIVTLSDARERVRVLRKQLVDGKDPLAEKAAAAAERKTFGWCTDAFIQLHAPGWKNDAQAHQWRQSLADHGPSSAAFVDAISTAAIVDCLRPIWTSKTETAARVRGRIERILDWARVSGYRAGENPARWRGHLDKLLPKPTAVKRVKHHAAMPYSQIPDLMVSLAARKAHAARALRFTILTAARTDEVTGAAWSEFDIDGMLWTVPAQRMKAQRQHVVPLSAAAVNLIKELPRQIPPFALSENTMLYLIQRHMELPFTVHGFRSSFRDWVSETTHYSGEIAEMALAHTIKNKVEAAYRRGDLLTKRRELMDAWALFCMSKT